jgi:hypothetical protein
VLGELAAFIAKERADGDGVAVVCIEYLLSA